MTNSAVSIYHEAEQMLDSIGERPVRLVGVGIQRLSDHEEGQMTIREFFEETAEQDAERQRLLDALQVRYGLDFAGHLTDSTRWTPSTRRWNICANISAPE